MIIICPNCQLKGEIAGPPVSSETHVTCARCAKAFVVSLVHDESLLASSKATANAGQSAEATPARASSLRERIAMAEGRTRSLVPLPPVASLPPRKEVPFTHAQKIASSPAAAHAPVPVARPAVLFPSPASEAAPPIDGYREGTRLLRLSPLWLLVVGISVAAFVVFCNWLIRPDLRATDTALNLSLTSPRGSAPAGNSTTNQSATAAAPPEFEESVEIEVPGSPDVVSDKAGRLPAEPLADAQMASPAGNVLALLPPQENNSEPGGFTVQLGSFNKIEEAQALVSKLEAAGLPARLDVKETPKKKVWYRVHSGIFSSHDEAAAYGRQLREQKAAADFIITPTS